ncbi:hypothetical protein H4O20_14315 [Aequorivita sp. 609]|uniref:hypothetical protein n=1 Tax=Aequorivita TaxID=153265 RepID=UPI00111CFFD5|nr:MULTISPECIES: hypothetical protein [Aequorivita]MBB6682619.1 hypothetical protein [Aequorivita sp. 609]
MKKLFLTSILFLAVVTLASAQITINLPYSRSIGFENGGWEKWPSNWESQKAEYGFIPNLSIKQINLGTFEVSLYEGGSASGIFVETVHFDAAETKKVRKKSNNDNITVYKYYNSPNYMWTENVTLPQIVSNKANWTSKANSRIYIWYNDLGSAVIYKHNK